MKRISLISAAVAVLVLAVAISAYANLPSSQTTFAVTSTVTPKEAGTSKSPKAVKERLGMSGATTTGAGSPQTSKRIDIQLPKTLKWYGDKLPKSKRCDGGKASDQKSDSVCPKASKIGSGHVDASNSNETTQSRITEAIDLTAYVLKDGSLGLWLHAEKPAVIDTMLTGKISKQHTKISVAIPSNVQQPVAGVPTGIDNLTFTLKGKVKAKAKKGKKGKSYGAISSIGCKQKKWTVSVTNFYADGGKITKSDDSPCKAAKKKK
jgi:hypothetical protein